MTDAEKLDAAEEFRSSLDGSDVPMFVLGFVDGRIEELRAQRKRDEDALWAAHTATYGAEITRQARER